MVTEKATRPRDGWALLVAAGGLLLTAAMLLSSLPAGTGATGTRETAGGRAAHATQADDGDSDDGSDVGTVAGPERCDDGLDAAASYGESYDGGTSVQTITDRGYINVGIDLNSYLWGYRESDTGDIVGFDIDLVRAIAESLFGEYSDETVHLLAIPTAEREQAVQDGTVDMVVRTMSITCERWENVAFSAAYFETGQQIVAPRDSGITGYDETLAGKRVCSAEGSTAQEQLQAESFGATLITRANHLDCLVLVQLGEADALMTDSALAAGHAAQDPAVELVGDPVTAESYGVAINQENVDLVRWVNAVLADYVADGGWSEAYDTWLRPYMGERSSESPAPDYSRG